ncbi:MAG TPA: formimidoylglutamate deiminase [Usitatibacter sp.]|nr:formimidoylglutamate deiminase [Usitatibacter sp.]
MPTLHASDALLPSGWARDVLLDWNDEGTLRAVTPGSAAAGHPRAAGAVLPGMTNVHSHAFQRAMAGLAATRGHPTDDFWTWREEMYRLVARIEPEDTEAIAAYLYIEMLRHGYTSVAEFHYLHNDRAGNRYDDIAEMAHGIAGAAAASGIALTLLPVLYAHGGFGHKPLSEAQRRFRGDPAFIVGLLEELTHWHMPSTLMRLGVAPHSVRAVDALMLTDVVSAARAMDPTMPFHMHVSEQVAEVAQCLETHGATPFEWVSQLVEVDARWCFIHGTHLTAAEMGRMAASGACIGLCPTTEADLGDGIFDFPPWFERRGPWAIGGDSHVATSPMAELRMLEHSQRLRLRVRNVASDEARPDVAANLWSGAAAGGARAAAHPAGELVPGRRADFVVLDGEDVDFEGLGAPAMLGVAMFCGGRNRVRDVYVAGRAVVERGVHPEEAEARASYGAALRRLRRAS